MCAGDEFELQVELGGSLTLNKETMYTEKANSVNSCTFGQVHENMVKCSSKRDSQQWPLVQILTKEEISAPRSVGQEGKRKLHVVRQQERLPKKKTKFPLQVVENQGKASENQWG